MEETGGAALVTHSLLSSLSASTLQQASRSSSAEQGSIRKGEKAPAARIKVYHDTLFKELVDEPISRRSSKDSVGGSSTNRGAFLVSVGIMIDITM